MSTEFLVHMGGGDHPLKASSSSSSHQHPQQHQQQQKHPQQHQSSSHRHHNANRRVRKRCGNCPACRRNDCGVCIECVRKKKFGGTGDSKQACIERRCLVLEKLKKERKRHRAAGLPVDDYQDEYDMLVEVAAASGAEPPPPPRKRQKKQQPGRRSASGGGGGSGRGSGAMHSSHDDTASIDSSGRRHGGGDDDDDDDHDHYDDDDDEDMEEEKDPLTVQLEQAFPGPLPSLLATTQVARAAAAPPTNRTTRWLADYKYGMPVQDPAIEVCAGCRRMQPPKALLQQDDDDDDDDDDKDGVAAEDDEDPIILLCDGPNCQSEYHLQCCIPPISEVPAGNYYCVDCNPTGSTSVLEQYLDRHEDRRAEAVGLTSTGAGSNSSGEYDFLFQLWREDLLDNQDNWNDEKPSSSRASRGDHNNADSDDDSDTKNSHRIPQSELAALLELQHHLLGGPPPSKPCTLTELCDMLLGKPVRLYCPLDDNYHSGRIVDYRPIPINLLKIPKKSATKASNNEQQATSQTYNPPPPLKFPDMDAKNWFPNDDLFANKVEFLVRFVPGSHEYRKTLLYRWIRLEEHSLAVGTHLVWGKFKPATASATTTTTTTATSPHASPAAAAAKRDPPVTDALTTTTIAAHFASTSTSATMSLAAWQPAILFLRTTRELMPVLHLLQEDEGEISYHPWSVTQAMNASVKSSRSSSSSAGKSRRSSASATGNPFPTQMPRKDPHKVWALAKRLGSTTLATTDETKAENVNADDDNMNSNSPEGGGSNGGSTEAYKLLRIHEEARDFFARKPGASRVDQLKHSMALAEYNEQRMVADWKHNWTVQQQHKFHPLALKSRDEFALGPVRFQNLESAPLSRDEQELCPLIRPPGLDRSYLMDRLIQRGIIGDKEATRETAAGLECWLVP